MAYKKKDPKDRIGHSHSSVADQGPITRGRSRREGIAIPTANPDWMPEARSWFNSLKLSGQSDLYEASDWSTGVAAARALDIAIRSHNASLFASFVRLSERLAVTVVDRSRARIELDEPDQADRDEDHADATIINWQARLAEARKINQDRSQDRDDGA